MAQVIAAPSFFKAVPSPVCIAIIPKQSICACICGDCVTTCPTNALTLEAGKVLWNSDKCVDCDTCIHTCTHLASPKIRYMSVEELVEQIKAKKAFLRGITVSGGECMNHAAFQIGRAHV